MDITETFRSEDISKTDFFDFVVGPDVNDAQFSKQMRTVNAYLGNGDTTDIKVEPNNNSDAMLDTVTTVSSDVGTVTNYDSNFWACDKETVRLETAILEDLNKYCWSQQDVNSATGNSTDGHIYTLTVLNGVDQTTPWYRPPLAAIIKEEDGSLSSPGSLEHMQQSALDIDSILNIIPGPGTPLNGYSNNVTPNTDGLIKSEPYTYDDSGYADTKDELANTIIIDTPMLEVHDSFNNNNNDWKLNNNNNTPGSTTPTGADSLLRSALQGKAFVRYNGAASKTTKSDTHSELRRALSTPPAHTESKDPDDQQQSSTSQPDLITGIDTGAVLFIETTPRLPEENPPSAHSMDDILLSQLDSASYPEDYEKLKRIANEVAESVQQYCQLEPIYGIELAAPTTDQPQTAVQPTQLPQQAAVTSSKPPTTKKYKRSNSAGANSAKTGGVQATSTSGSNGVRKERSLHYCSICSKGFKDKYSVNVHIRTHTGEKPFACSLCGKSFRQKAHLAKHYQTHIAQKNAAASGAAAKAR